MINFDKIQDQTLRENNNINCIPTLKKMSTPMRMRQLFTRKTPIKDKDKDQQENIEVKLRRYSNSGSNSKLMTGKRSLPSYSFKNHSLKLLLEQQDNCAKKTSLSLSSNEFLSLQSPINEPPIPLPLNNIFMFIFTIFCCKVLQYLIHAFY